MRAKSRDIVKSYEHSKIQNYILKYIDELRLHFDVEQKDLEKIVGNCYGLIKTPSPAKKFLDMVKSSVSSVWSPSRLR